MLCLVAANFVRSHTADGALWFRDGFHQLYLCLYCVGFSTRKTLTVTNTSDVPLTYHASVPDDGSRPPVCFDQRIVNNHCHDREQTECDTTDLCDEQPPADAPDACDEQPWGSDELAAHNPEEQAQRPETGSGRPSSR